MIIVSAADSKVGGELGGYSLAPSVFYYFIAKAILIDKNLPDGNEKPSENADGNENSDMFDEILSEKDRQNVDEEIESNNRQ